ncbi:MAG TPA: adenine deaminase [Desulfobacteraceae bacterium]|nr:adenine deaminase [Desulfobacteraceae bacterium]
MGTPTESLRRRILAGKGEIPADLVLKNGRVVNLFSNKIQKGDVAVSDGFIVGVGLTYHGKIEVDVSNRWVIPGLIDGHLHIESSMLSPSHIAAALLVHGTTAIVADPHEIANVLGLKGIRYMLKESSDIPFDIFFMAPSCVPATHLETSGATLTASDLKGLLDEPRILGLAEMMNFPGVLMGDPQVLEKIVLFQDRVVDGHCPMLSGYDLQAYLSAGIGSDHESTLRQEALEKMENGMMLMIREGTSARNLDALLPLVTDMNRDRFCFVSDDLHAEDIQDRGHLDFVMRKAVRSGLDPMTAIRLATLNPAAYFGLRGKGAIAPGYQADIVVLSDLETFAVDDVYKDGRQVVQDGEPVDSGWWNTSALSHEPFGPLSIAPFHPGDFRIPHPGGRARIIELVPGQILTRTRMEAVPSVNGFVKTSPERDLLKLAVVERHTASGNIGLGLVSGFGLLEGAIASSIAHDSHNVIVAGVTDEEICRAVEVVRDMGGGLAVVRGHETCARVPLEIGGLMSTQPLQKLVPQLMMIKRAAVELGCPLEDPFMALSFLALPVIPELKLTDKGLVDVNRFELVPLFVEA